MVICILCTSCGGTYYIFPAPTSHYLIGNYPTAPTHYNKKAYYEIWNNVIQYSSSNYIDIKLDSSKGLIVLKRIKLTASYEDDNGNLFFPESYIAVERGNSEQGSMIKRPERTYAGDVDIYFSFENNSTAITMKLEKVGIIDEYYKSDHGMYYVPKEIFKSTSILENIIYDNIK